MSILLAIALTISYHITGNNGAKNCYSDDIGDMHSTANVELACWYVDARALRRDGAKIRGDTPRRRIAHLGRYKRGMACCRCNRTGSCKGCVCVKAGNPCTSCLPSKLGSCVNSS